MSCVLDASVTLPWLYERTTEAERSRSIAILEQLDESPAVVPVLWMAEVLNAIVVGERRKIISATQSPDFPERLSALNNRSGRHNGAPRCRVGRRTRTLDQRL